MTRLIFLDHHLHATVTSMLRYVVIFICQFNDIEFLKYKCFQQPDCAYFERNWY
jgi:hypothetical protein